MRLRPKRCTWGTENKIAQLTLYIDICRVRGMTRMKIPRLSPQTIRILEEFLQSPAVWRYGYELSRETGLRPGTLYPILMRLAKYSLVETRWVVTENGVPPRHTYRLTSRGAEAVKAALVQSRSARRVRHQIASGSPA